MLIAVITGPSLRQAQQQMKSVVGRVDALEFRVDLWDEINAIPTLIQQTQMPVILTLRSQRQGGKFSGTQEEKIAYYHRMAQWQPTYMDVDIGASIAEFNQLQQQYPHIQWIYSYHIFHYTPYHLTEIFAGMQEATADYYKIVTYAQDPTDALRMINFIKESAADNLIAFCMGEVGQWTRIISPILGCANMFYLATSADNRVVADQLTIDEWYELYQAPMLNAQTEIYALIGSPVSQSIGHIYHNQKFKQENKNAVYVKIPLTASELTDFFTTFRHTNLKGLSVTMPLKNAVIPFIDTLAEHAKAAEAVNTITFANNISGTNTDGEGVIEVLLTKTVLADKKIIILGCGNTARAIAIAASTQNAEVILLARNEKQHQAWAQGNNMMVESFNKLPAYLQDYDILINATSVGMKKHASADWINSIQFLAQRIVLDCVVSKNDTPFLAKAKQAGCECINGAEMFAAQARLQGF